MGWNDSSVTEPSGLKLIVLSTALKNPKLFAVLVENSHPSSSIRYYLKSNMETETLCSDEDAQDLLREGQISLLQLSTVEVATQLSMRAFELFCAIEPTEYIDDLFKLRSKTGSVSLKRFEEAINHETFWVATEVTREPNQLKRMKIIKHFIKIALHCRECKNFSSMFAIIR